MQDACCWLQQGGSKLRTNITFAQHLARRITGYHDAAAAAAAAGLPVPTLSLRDSLLQEAAECLQQQQSFHRYHTLFSRLAALAAEQPASVLDCADKYQSFLLVLTKREAKTIGERLQRAASLQAGLQVQDPGELQEQQAELRRVAAGWQQSRGELTRRGAAVAAKLDSLRLTSAWAFAALAEEARKDEAPRPGSGLGG